MNYSKAFWILFLVLLFSTFGFAQDALFEVQEDQQQNTDCMPESLSVVYDKYANAPNADTLV